MASRQYDLVVFGATGFTGKYVSEHVTTSLPTDLKWAIAGRSAEKLQNIAEGLRALNPDRPQPEIETCSLDKAQVAALVRRTKVLITTIGPYNKYGTSVIEACAENGTHYFDVTGESPWVLDMIKKYDGVAKKNKAIIIPQIGVDSAPADLLSWSLVTHIRSTLSAATAELFYTIYDLKGAPSGGTLLTVLSLFDSYNINDVTNSMKAWSMSPIGPPPHSESTQPKSLFEKLLGVRTVKDLGVLTTSIQGAVDATQVYRSWGLLGKGEYYGPKFRFYPYMRARNVFTGVLAHLAITFGFLALLIRPVRALLQRLVYQPGDGPSREAVKHDFLEYRAIATADTTDPADPKRVFGKFRWEGSAYHLTGVFAAEAAITLLRDETLAGKIGGGFLTPATLGTAYVERLQKAGIKIEVNVMP